MPRYVNRVPKPRLHKPSGQARVRSDGRDYYLGVWNSPIATRRYQEWLKDWLARRSEGRTEVDRSAITIDQAMLEFMEWSREHYRDADGNPTRGDEDFKRAFRFLRRLWSNLPLVQFGPNKLRTTQTLMVESGLTRQGANKLVGKLRQFFNWCVGHELMPGHIARDLEHVEGIRPRPGVRESPRRKPVDWGTVEVTLPFLSPLMRAFTLVMWHTGARMSEIRLLTTGMLDRTDATCWRADLDKHKTAHHGKPRVILFGPQAIAALEPWLRPFELDAPIFSPRRADERSATRRGPKAPGEHYQRNSPAHAITRACALAFPHPTLSGKRKLTVQESRELKVWNKRHRWALAQLRHARATMLRERFGIDVAKLTLGHSKDSMTEHYSGTAILPAIEAARKSG